MDLRTIPLISRYFNVQEFKSFGSLIDPGNAAKFMCDTIIEYDVRIIEIAKTDPIVDVLTCNHVSKTLLIPLEDVSFYLPVGPAIDAMRSRPFPGTNEIKVFYSESKQGFILEKDVWFADPIVSKTSKWLEISRSTDIEKRNYANILKVNFKLEPPN